jgi:hypothetical protein
VHHQDNFLLSIESFLTTPFKIRKMHRVDSCGVGGPTYTISEWRFGPWYRVED